MQPVIAVIAAGAMGAGLGRVLSTNGARVLTSLEGRSAATADRAQASEMEPADDATIAAADLILSVLPPGEAVALAQRFAPVLASRERKAVYADCNAISPDTMREVAAALSASGTLVVDAGIIGTPPSPGKSGPTLYFCGPGADRFATLMALGIKVSRIEGPIGAASALKLSYAGITKGTTAIVSAMLLGAARNGTSAALRAELTASQPAVLARSAKAIPEMVPKAYRWVAEMREIAHFLGKDDPGFMIYEGIARLYERIAEDEHGPRDLIAQLDAVLKRS